VQNADAYRVDGLELPRWFHLCMAGETIMGLAYGLKIQEKEDPYVEAAAKGVHPLMVAAMPGAFLVDSIPILKPRSKDAEVLIKETINEEYYYA
ncbi:hypothetical protein H0H92_003228, partial [Tricholoma furcatifolium]